MDGRTDVPKYEVRTDGRALSAVLLGLLGGVNLKMKITFIMPTLSAACNKKKPTQLLTISQSQFAVLVVRV